jgi:hypothetical protein
MKMNTWAFLWASLLLLSSVKGFAPLSPAVKNNPCSRQWGRRSAACTRLSLSQDSNQEGESSSKVVEDDETAKEEDSLDDYDFEAGFQARLKKEGGTTGVKVKTAAKSVKQGAKRSVDSVSQGVTETGNILGLLTSSEWGMTVGVLALVVVLAIGTHFSSPAPFETTSTGEQLTFGAR